MDIETFRDYCLSLNGTTEGMKWDLLCFMIEEKIFVLTSLDDGRLCFKCDPDDFDALVSRDGITQAPHFARRQWIAIDDLEVMPENELKERISASRSLVLNKLSKKIQAKYEH
jgi:predicted DNA-binding protein (MmcQ/YjbR family)